MLIHIFHEKWGYAPHPNLRIHAQIEPFVLRGFVFLQNFVKSSFGLRCQLAAILLTLPLKSVSQSGMQKREEM